MRNGGARRGFSDSEFKQDAGGPLVLLHALPLSNKSPEGVKFSSQGVSLRPGIADGLYQYLHLSRTHEMNLLQSESALKRIQHFRCDDEIGFLHILTRAA
jgi:hypothetical protein